MLTETGHSWPLGECAMVAPLASHARVICTGMNYRQHDAEARTLPAGVGFARQPPEFLRAGDAPATELSGLGMLRNTAMASAVPDPVLPVPEGRRR